jgi:catechol 2,3-dioxygenase-like lactoylglutathione lyase family enzyme
MLDTMKLVAFVPTTDYDKARAFYVDTLGLRFVGSDGHAMVLDAIGTHIRVTRVGEFQPFQWTVLGWQVPDIEAAVAELGQRGVRFEQYGFPGQAATGIWTAPTGDKVAWFKDPDGNTLSVAQHV